MPVSVRFPVPVLLIERCGYTHDSLPRPRNIITGLRTHATTGVKHYHRFAYCLTFHAVYRTPTDNAAPATFWLTPSRLTCG